MLNDDLLSSFFGLHEKEQILSKLVPLSLLNILSLKPHLLFFQMRKELKLVVKPDRN